MATETPDLQSLIEAEISASLNGTSGDTGDDPAGAEPEERTAHRAPRTAQGDAPEAESGPAAEDDWFDAPEEKAAADEALFRWDELPEDPAIQKLAKGLQGTFTKKSQELAEQRKALEAERQRLAQYEQYEAIKRQDPVQARRLLEQELEQLQGGAPRTAHSAPPEPDATGQLLAQLGQSDLTPEEQGLLTVAQQIYQQNLSLQQQQQLFQQQRLMEQQRQEQQEAERQIQAEVAEVEAQIGRKIPAARDAQIRQYAVSRGLPSYKAAFWELYGPEIVKRAQQEGARQAERTLSRKSLQSAMPPGAPPRTPGEPRPPRDLKGSVFAALEQFGIE